MVKLRALSVFALFFSMVLRVDAVVALPTFDAPVLGTDVGMVGQGITSIRQFGESIANGSLMNSILGDSAGALANLRKKYGKEIDKAQKALEDAKKRIEDGKKAYEEYTKEIEKRKKEYQELMDSVESFRDEIKGFVYDDSENEVEDYAADYDVDFDADFDAETVSTLRTAEIYAEKNFADDPYNSYTGDVKEMRDIPQTNFEVPTFDKLPENNSTFNIQQQPDAVEPILQPKDANMSDKALSLEKKNAEDANPAKELLRTDVEKTEKVSSIVNETTGRKRFIEAPQKNAVTKAEKSVEKVSASVPAPSISLTTKSSASTFDVAPTAKIGAPEGVKDSPVISKPVLPSYENKATTPAAERQFRVSPTVKTDKISTSTIRSGTRMMFAASVGGATKGSNYDENGTYISPFAKRCGLSIDDLVNNDEKVSECLQKIVRENHAENSFDAENNRKDCQKMVYEMVFAVAAETSKIRNDAAGYDKTIESMREQGEESTDIRGDMSVIASNNEKILQKLNEMSQMMSAYTLLQAVEQVCAAPKEVVAGAESSNGDE